MMSVVVVEDGNGNVFSFLRTIPYLSNLDRMCSPSSPSDSKLLLLTFFLAVLNVL